jgi:hypothetical protein
LRAENIFYRYWKASQPTNRFSLRATGINFGRASERLVGADPQEGADATVQRLNSIEIRFCQLSGGDGPQFQAPQKFAGGLLEKGHGIFGGK